MEKQLIPKLRFPKFSDVWNKNKVVELADYIVPGRNKPKKFNGSIPWITTPDIEHNGIVIRSKKGLAISSEEAKKVGAKIVPTNSVMISCVGELGLTALTGVEMVINQQLHAFIPKEKIDNRFLLYSISNQKKYMDKVATKTAVPYMNKDNCNSIPVIYPTLSEQQKIAQFLTAIDTRIQNLEKKKTLLEQYKKGVMQKIFKRELRFKDDDGKEFLAWEKRKLSSIMSIPEKISPKKIDSSKILTVKLHLNGIYLNERTDGLKIGSTKYIQRRKGQFIYGKQNLFNGAFGIIPAEFDGFLSSGDVPSLDIDNKIINSMFLFYYFSRKSFYKKLENISSGSGSKRIHEKTLLKLDIRLPCIPEQTKIANFLSAIDKKIDLTHQQIEHSKTYKKGLLQQMFV